VTVKEPAAAHEPGYDTTNRVFSTVYPDKGWEEVGGDYNAIASLAADRNGNVYFPDPVAGRIDRVDAAGKVTQFTEPPNYASIVRTGPGDRLLSYQPSTGNLISSSTEKIVASDEKTLARNLMGIADFVVTQNGTIYFIDEPTGTIGLIDASGQPHIAVKWTDLDAEMTAPKGLALSPDQSMLVVTDSVSRYSWSFQIAADGTLRNGEPFFRLEMPETAMLAWASGTRGAADDVSGMVYFATPVGIQIAMQNGRIVEILNPPITGGGPLTAIAFAGGAGDGIYAAQSGKLFRRPVKVAGANAWTVVKPPKPTL